MRAAVTAPELFGRPLRGTVNIAREAPWTVTAYGLNGRPMLYEKCSSKATASRRACALMLRSDVLRVKGEPQ